MVIDIKGYKVEIDARFTGCLLRLDEFIDTTMAAMREKI